MSDPKTKDEKPKAEKPDMAAQIAALEKRVKALEQFRDRVG